jgi:hypothetical protein
MHAHTHTHTQTDVYLEELTDVVPETDNTTQTDAFLERPATPPFVPAKSGMDATTQIEDGARTRGVTCLGWRNNPALGACHCSTHVLPASHQHTARHPTCPHTARLGELFDFDREVEPLLEVLVGKVLEQALAEVLEEEELAAMRAAQAHFEALR